VPPVAEPTAHFAVIPLPNLTVAAKMPSNVEMVFGKAGTAQFSTFSCSDLTWAALLELGSLFGWTPAGTTPGESARQPHVVLDGFESNYRPYDWANCKRVSEDDAEALADALELAIHAIRMREPDEEMMTDPRARANGNNRARLVHLPTELIADFISFLRNGEFVFARDLAVAH
jgi:hypothetical protein